MTDLSDNAREIGPGASIATRNGLRLESRANLSIRRVKRGETYRYIRRNGRAVRDASTLRRLKALAVPPAYEDVRYSQDAQAHLQAVGRDAAGRLQYRYHPDWETVRESRKARRLMRFVSVLPKIRRSVAQHLSGDRPSREFAFSGVIELVARTAIRPGHESYVKLHKTRGATTLLKSNVRVEEDCLVLSFRGKGGKLLRKECDAAVLVRAVETLRELPGPRLFQYRDDDGSVKQVTANQVNVFLRDIAGVKISLKDFRTLMACAAVIESLARVAPAESAGARRRQVLEAVRSAADELTNTPAICRRSYVHESIVTAFENRLLERFSSTLKGCRSLARRERVLAQVLALGQSGVGRE